MVTSKRCAKTDRETWHSAASSATVQSRPGCRCRAKMARASRGSRNAATRPEALSQPHSTQPRTIMAATTSARRARMPANPTRPEQISPFIAASMGSSPG
ncbi:hypothetical protein D3C78_1449890 [compost metagenome]